MNSSIERNQPAKDDTMPKSNAYLVFERPIGSRCWTLAEKKGCQTGPGTYQWFPAMFTDRQRAESFIQEESNRRPLINLPNGNRTKNAFHVHEVCGMPE